MQIIGLDLQVSCQPAVVHQDQTGPSGVISLTCGGTARNITPYRLVTWARLMRPGGTGSAQALNTGGAAERLSWTLYPGTPPIMIPDPPAGGYWMLYTETGYQQDYGGILILAGAAGALGLAGLAGRLIARRGR